MDMSGLLNRRLAAGRFDGSSTSFRSVLEALISLDTVGFSKIVRSLGGSVRDVQREEDDDARTESQSSGLESLVKSIVVCGRD